MDPFAALGLASNIISFVDFSCKLFTNAKEICNSASGTSSHVTEIAAITKSLHALTLKLATTPWNDASGLNQPEPVDTVLAELASGCRHIASKLLVVVDGLQARYPNSKWKSFRVALKTMFKEQQIQDMQRTLEEYRRQIVLRLGVMQSERNSDILWKVNALYEANSGLRADLAGQIDDLRSSIVDSINQIKMELSRQDTHSLLGRMKRSKEVPDEFTKTLMSREPISVEPWVRSLMNSAQIGSKMFTSLRLIRTLRFNYMDFRYTKITTAHKDTLQWIFGHTFSHWLASDNPIFWISGKPGSGKSTLMKFLVDNKDLQRYLVPWNHRGEVIVASYFFWVNGTEIQRSQEGLLQSLLYDIVRHDPLIIHAVFPKRWQMLEAGYQADDFSPWSRQELLDGITQLLCDGLLSFQLCIFIDGLDEYEGEHEDLIHMVRGLTQSGNVKLCIASRPWNVFENAFGACDMHKIYLEDYNKSDISLYVKNNLEDRPDFREIRARNQEADQLAPEIIEKSQGVFLWVYLVVRSLIHGLQNWDRVSDLQRRLRSFPSDLDSFFKHILLSLDDHYRVQAARTFQVALAAPRTLSLLNCWYVDLEEIDPNMLATVPVQALSLVELEIRQDEMRKRLNGRFKGLLEVTHIPRSEPPYNCRVDFLHRTVKDFLRTKELQQLLNEWSGERIERVISPDQHRRQPSQTLFNAYMTLCKSTLAELRSAPVKYYSPGAKGPMIELVDDFFFSVQQYEIETGKSLRLLLGELNITVTRHSIDYSIDRLWFRIGYSEDIATHAVKWDLLKYIQETLDASPLSTVETARLLRHALRGRFDQNGQLALGPNQQMLETILKRGPSVTLNANAVRSAVSWLQNVTEHGLYGCLMLLAVHNALQIESDSAVWKELEKALTVEEISSLKDTVTEKRPCHHEVDNNGIIAAETQQSVLKRTHNRFWCWLRRKNRAERVSTAFPGV
ncbi:hypothetical protein F5Y19DRAFT_458426 [Xylariaceae sp. FL1651]|nr:hypothetical protein F5Y19DRAFT_458426 [Xylariaceae sp. FL1651]